jgi:hypothetical protein
MRSCYHFPVQRRIVARKVALADLDDSFDVDFWASIPPDERFAETWRLSEEIWRLSGRDPGEPGLPRSVAVLVRR